MEQTGSTQGMTQGTCPDCGYAHPPVQGGCPMKKTETETGTVVDVQMFFTPFKSILEAQIKMKEVNTEEELKTFFNHMIVECTKVAESYTK